MQFRPSLFYTDLKEKRRRREIISCIFPASSSKRWRSSGGPTLAVATLLAAVGGPIHGPSVHNRLGARFFPRSMFDPSPWPRQQQPTADQARLA